MKTVEMKLNELPFKQIKSGAKTVELRLNDEKRKTLEIGDIIVFTCVSDVTQTLRVTVTALHRYPSFFELFQRVQPLVCGFGNDSPSEASAQMRTYYTEEQEKEHGALGIEIKLETVFA